MKRVAFVAITLGVAGCALIIDLGDEPKLAPVTDGAAFEQPDTSTANNDATIAETGSPDVVVPSDAGSDATKPPCGLDDSPTEACWKCVHASKTCDVSKECAAEPGCVSGLECIKHCLSQSACVNDCSSQDPSGKLFNLTLQIAGDCNSQCVPGLECQRLGTCAFPLPNNAIFRISAEQAILRVDEAECKSIRAQIREQDASDVPTCSAQ